MGNAAELTNNEPERGTGGVSASDYRIVPTQAVPNWHTPSRCSVIERWPGYQRGIEWSPKDVDRFDAWLAANPAEMARCWYHQQGYERAMVLAIRAMRLIQRRGSCPQGCDAEDMPISDAVEAVLSMDEALQSSDIALAGVLVEQPIIWSESNDFLTDGQHRMCALRAAGAAEILVCRR